jgi:Tfp pilus assembly protein FimT
MEFLRAMCSAQSPKSSAQWRNRFSRRDRGVTLIELTVYMAVWATVALATMHVLGDARMTRANARDRGVMTLIAQGELERVRQLPAAALKEGSENRKDPDWPSGVTATVTLKRRDDATWLVDVQVERESPEGKPHVRLTTIRAGGTP